MAAAPSSGVGTLELRGWKSIAGYLKISTSSALVYANRLKLPIRKLGDGRGSPVIAFADELDVWKKQTLKPRAPYGSQVLAAV